MPDLIDRAKVGDYTVASGPCIRCGTIFSCKLKYPVGIAECPNCETRMRVTAAGEVVLLWERA